MLLSLLVSMVVEGSHGNRGLLPSSTSIRLLTFLPSPGRASINGKEKAMDVVHPRCAGVDVSKRDAKVCVRVPDTGRAKAKSTVTTWSSVTNQVLMLRDHLIAERVTLVVMEATSDYWKPFYYVLEDGPFEVMLVNARHVKNLPGRKTDVSDAAWLAELGAHGLVRGSFVPPEPIRQLRDLTRTRTTITRDRAREIQRLEKLLEDAGIKLSSVARDITGVSGRLMLAALIAGERDPAQLAELAKRRMRAKIPEAHRGAHRSIRCAPRLPGPAPSRPDRPAQRSY